MTVRPVIAWPDTRLRRPTVAVERFDDDLIALYRDLVDTMAAEDGLGLAAPQIGDHRRVFVVAPTMIGWATGAPPAAFVNPEVVAVSGELESSVEGCLSFPGVGLKIERPRRVSMRAQDLNAAWFEVEASGLGARCLLHEYDHLNGRLMIDYVGAFKRDQIRRKLSRKDP